MNKKTAYIIIAVLLTSSVIGAYLYYRNYKYNYIDTVTSYIKIEYTQPVEDPFYDTYSGLEKATRDRYSDPKIEFSYVKFDNDSVAVAETYKNCKHFYDGITDELIKLEPEYTPNMSEVKREIETRKYQVKTMALSELLNKCTYLISFTHIRKFDKKKFLKDVIEIGLNKEKLDEYMKKNKISFKWYDVFII